MCLHLNPSSAEFSEWRNAGWYTTLSCGDEVVSLRPATMSEMIAAIELDQQLNALSTRHRSSRRYFSAPKACSCLVERSISPLVNKTSSASSFFRIDRTAMLHRSTANLRIPPRSSTNVHSLTVSQTICPSTDMENSTSKDQRKQPADRHFDPFECFLPCLQFILTLSPCAGVTEYVGSMFGIASEWRRYSSPVLMCSLLSDTVYPYIVTLTMIIIDQSSWTSSWRAKYLPP